MTQVVRKQISLRKLCILGLFAANDAGEQHPQALSGRTRLQKLLRLIKKEIEEHGGAGQAFKFDYKFEKEKFGPADLQVYQDLEFLSAMRLIAVNGITQETKTVTKEPRLEQLVVSRTLGSGEPTLPEEEEESELSFEYLMGHHPEELLMAEAEDEEVETQYEITSQGQEILKQIRERLDADEAARFDQVLATCANIRGQYGSWPLKTLLRHVYATFPAETTKSIIKDDLF